MMVILRPLTKDAWSGIIKYKNCYTDLAPYFTRTGQIYTGLTVEDEKMFEKKLRFTEGHLANHSDFWKTFHVRTTGKDLYLDLTEPLDELKYYFLKSHKHVANGFGDRKATANFILINQEAEARESNVFNRLKRRAIIEFNKLTTDEMRQCLRIFGHSADNMDNEMVEQKLMEIVEGNPEKFINNWVNNTTKGTEYLIKTAVSKNILRKNKTIYKYGTDIIGNTLEDAIDYLDDPNNNLLKTTILRELESKQ